MLYIDEYFFIFCVVTAAAAAVLLLVLFLFSSSFHLRNPAFFSLFGSFTLWHKVSQAIRFIICCVVKFHYEMKQFIFLCVFYAICWFSRAFFGLYSVWMAVACCSCSYGEVESNGTRWGRRGDGGVTDCASFISNISKWTTILRSNDCENQVQRICFCICFRVGAFSLLFLFILSFFFSSVP